MNVGVFQHWFSETELAWRFNIWNRWLHSCAFTFWYIPEPETWTRLSCFHLYKNRYSMVCRQVSSRQQFFLFTGEKKKFGKKILQIFSFIFFFSQNWDDWQLLNNSHHIIILKDISSFLKKFGNTWKKSCFFSHRLLLFFNKELWSTWEKISTYFFYYPLSLIQPGSIV